MKRLNIFSKLIVLLLLLSATAVSAQGGLAPNPTPVPPVNVDTDGDGIPDSNDNCPTVAGPRENNGCPVTFPPPAETEQPTPPVEQPPVEQPPVVEQPRFEPPVLPNDACYVTPMSTSNVNVRQAPDMAAAVIGQLFSGKVYEARGYIMLGTEIWFVLTNYEGATGMTGYGSRSVLRASACQEIRVAAPATESAASFPWQVSVEAQEGTGNGEQPDTLEYCILQEVGEVGIFKEVCYEVEIPEGCVVHSTEAGVFTIDCGEPVTLNPLLDDLPAEGLAIPTRDQALGVVLQMSFGTPHSSSNTTVEYCIYQEVEEVGVFKEVCYEVEVPQGCWLESAEAGVFTMHCRPEIGGESSFTFNRSTHSNNDQPTAGMDLVIRHDNPNPPVVFVPTAGSRNFRDCNNNGINDLDEFLPPVCTPDLTTDTDDDQASKETPEWWDQVGALACGGDYLYSTVIDEDGDEVVTNFECVNWDD